MTDRELDTLQARLSAGHFDIEEVGELLALANLAISELRGNMASEPAYRAENRALRAKLVAEKAVQSPADPA